MYNKVTTDLDFKLREKEILEFWGTNDVFKKSIEKRKDAKVFTFYDGPPTANGKPHIGHVLTRVMKDIIPRYKTMKGYKVLRKAGWDTHGLPVELEVEKLLGLDGKSQIEGYGVEPFVKKCKESVWKYEQEWKKMSDRIGFWADMDDPYVTYHNSYIESVWWAIKKIWDKGLIYKGHKVVPYCPRCGTSLSSHEVAQGYKDVTDNTIIAKFKVKSQENTYLLAWTTTPWTLPSNVALCFHPNEEYSKVKVKDEIYLLAKALCNSVLGEGKYEVLETKKGNEYEGLEYEPLFDFEKTDKKAYYVVNDEYVTLTDGTGVVHIAPAFGEDDANVGRKYDLPFVQLVDERGEFVERAYSLKGIFAKDADDLIIDDLKKRNQILKEEEHEHSYPFCWRCDTPLLYYARKTWFIKMTEVKDRLVANNDKINWMPDNIKKGRFGNFLENVVDWGLSRERYWGTPLPIWECDCGHKTAVGSIEQLKKEGRNVKDDIELHKPYIDQVLLKCEKCGSDSMKRVTEVIDCWFDSGAMPFAQWHYPFENKEIFEENFPANFISEAIDQTRGWFYTLLAISTLIFDEPSYKNVIVLGHVQDKDGQKMSKHKGNVVDPWEVLNKQGADAVRWYFYSNSSPWLPNRFHDEAVSEYQRKFMGTFWNTYAFYILYADIDKFDPTKHQLDKESLNVMDKWVLSKLNMLIKIVDNNLTEYKITESSRLIQDFVDELSNWYVRRSRERFWGSSMTQDKINAFLTLFTALETLTKITAPFVPFIAESIYQNLVKSVDENAPKSVHLCDYPQADESLIDKELEYNMDLASKVVTLGRACRNTANVKNRQPLANVFVKAPSTLPELYVDVVLDELNIKKLEYFDDSQKFVNYYLKPDRKVVGPKHGKILPKLVELLPKVDGNKAVRDFEEGLSLELEVDGQIVNLTKEDVLIETSQAEGFVSVAEGDMVVAIDTNLTDDLIDEGFERELISKIQSMRKEAGFEILDNIEVFCEGTKKINEVLEKFEKDLSKEVLAKAIYKNRLDGYVKEWSINGEDVKLGVQKV